MKDSKLFKRIVENHVNGNIEDARKQIKRYGVRDFTVDVTVDRYELNQGLKDKLRVLAVS